MLVQQSEGDMFLPRVVIEDYGSFEEYRQALKPVFDALWNAGGYEGSESYGPDGQWQRRS